MGLSLSLILSAWEETAFHNFFSLLASPRIDMTLRTHSFNETDVKTKSNESGKASQKDSVGPKSYEPVKVMLETSLSFKNLIQEIRKSRTGDLDSEPDRQTRNISLPEPAILFSPRSVSELDAAAIKVQKVYKSYRTRRNLADCAVVVEELWWKALDFAALRRSSVSFFNGDKPETAVSRWARAKTRVAKVGKGLLKDEKAQQLALQHWLEAIDPRHRYGHNLHMYYDVWFESKSSQPFFYWLDVGDGKEVNLEKCPRTRLQRQCIKYLGPNEREEYEVIVENGKLVFKLSGQLLETAGGSKWIFVLSTSRNLYVGQKKKGLFQHSSFLAGGATTAAGRLVAHGGVLEAIWPYSGHYRPTEENFREFIRFLEEHNVDLKDVKKCSIDEDEVSFSSGESTEEPNLKLPESTSKAIRSNGAGSAIAVSSDKKPSLLILNESEPPVFNMARRLSCKWTSGAGPRIGCVRDYPVELQSRALEQVNLSPRLATGLFGNYGPIPSPRPSPKVRLSPRLSYMGLPSPRTTDAAAN